MPKSIFESDIEKATNEYNVQEDWQLILDVCDRIKTLPNGPKDSLKCIMKRINHPVPHVAMQALTLLSACVDNCGKPFHLEICSRDWTNEAKNIVSKGHERVSQKLRELINKWATDFADDPQLNLMIQFHKKLKSEGFSFDFGNNVAAGSSSKSSSSTKVKSKSSEDELNFKEDLDLAIAMSLQDAEPQPQATSQSLYPTVTADSSPAYYQEESEICKVRALYDFEAAEDNEMTFKTGEIFSVLDNSDQNWWKGRNSLGIGLFPATFVTTDLVEEVKSEKKVRFADSDATAQPKKQKSVKQKVVINEEKGTSQDVDVKNQEQLDLTLSMLKNASPNEIDDEEETIVSMEESCRDMGTLIEKKILECDRQKDDLSDLNEKFLQALGVYQQMMKEPMVVAPAPPPQLAQQQVQYGQQYVGQPQSINHMQYQQQYLMQTGQYPPQHQPHLSQGYASLPDQTTIDKSYLYQGNPPMSSSSSSLAPIHGTPQPSSLPPMSASSQQQQYNSIQQYPQQQQQQAHALPQQPMSLPYDGQQQQQQLYSTQQQPQYDTTTGQYYAEPAEYHQQQTVDYSNYGNYNSVPQNTQVYQQTPIYQ